MSGERLTIGKDGLVTHIDTDDYVVDANYDYTSPPTYQSISATEDIATSNIFSMSHDIDGKMRISGDDADIEINGISLKQTLEDIQQRMAILQQYILTQIKNLMIHGYISMLNLQSYHHL